ncbi:MAG TPA: acyltransferase [Methylomirabilota bacterium]|nr:acyltransferase [Methylomirabilota bacterium]
MSGGRTLSWDWYPGEIPENVIVDETAYVETTFSFHLYRSRAPQGIVMGRGASAYLGTMFDVGPNGRVSLGAYALVHGARIICDREIVIGDFALISWNVVLMDSHRLSFDRERRREELRRVARTDGRRLEGGGECRPVRIGRNVWIGFDVCVLPGVTIGEGAVVGARSVVTEDVRPFTVVAGNPAHFVRELDSTTSHE